MSNKVTCLKIELNLNTKGKTGVQSKLNPADRQTELGTPRNTSVSILNIIPNNLLLQRLHHA